MVYQVKSNRMLVPFLGMKWNERILNPAGDFVYVIPGSIGWDKEIELPSTKSLGRSILNLKLKTASLLQFSL